MSTYIVMADDKPAMGGGARFAKLEDAKKFADGIRDGNLEKEIWVKTIYYAPVKRVINGMSLTEVAPDCFIMDDEERNRLEQKNLEDSKRLAIAALGI